MGAIGFIIGSRGSLKETLQVGTLPVLTLDLVFKQSDLSRQLPVRVMGFIGLGFRVANAALDYRLVDGIRFGCLLRHQAHPNEYPFDRSEHRVSLSFWVSL